MAGEASELLELVKTRFSIWRSLAVAALWPEIAIHFSRKSVWGFELGLPGKGNIFNLGFSEDKSVALKPERRLVHLQGLKSPLIWLLGQATLMC